MKCPELPKEFEDSARKMYARGQAEGYEETIVIIEPDATEPNAFHAYAHEMALFLEDNGQELQTKFQAMHAKLVAGAGPDWFWLIATFSEDTFLVKVTKVAPLVVRSKGGVC